MARINDNYLKLQAGYLFPEISRRVNAFAEANPEQAAKMIRCGIGDVTEPLPEAARNAMKAAVDELGQRATFRGYGPEQGYDFLRTAIAENNYRAEGIDVADDEIFVSDGSKCDTGNILDIFGPGNTIAITDPVYPVYVDTNVMAGNTGPADDQGAYDGLVYLPCTAKNAFVPAVPDRPVDLIYLCYPNNPTGATATREQLEGVGRLRMPERLDHPLRCRLRGVHQGGRDPPTRFTRLKVPARVPSNSDLSRKTVVSPASDAGSPSSLKNLPARLPRAMTQAIHPLWSRRQSTKFNGASYPIQRGAEALFSAAGKLQVKALINHYMENATLLREACRAAGLRVFGGVNAPYVWVGCPEGVTSWGMFDTMLNDASVVITPGSGFGAAGEGYFRISAFNSRDNVEEVCRRITALVSG